jgi:hypothetical protein
MVRLSALLLMVISIPACNDDKKEPEQEDKHVFSYQEFSKQFSEASLPYQLSDTALLNDKDTSTIKSNSFISLIPDSIKLAIFGKPEKTRYLPLVYFKEKGKGNYFLVKAINGARVAALLVIFDKDENYATVFPFLVPDKDPQTNQVSYLDKSFSISRNINRRTKDDVLTEGKEVYAYNEESKNFTLIMTDLLDDSKTELLNPIDTFPKKQQFSGDYFQGKNNLVSIRDGRDSREINFFIHFVKEGESCTGELKGTALFTTTKTAVYRQGGDPCVLELHFGSSNVTVKEIEGCGSHRGMQCLFDGTFSKKKTISNKQSVKKTLKQ